MSYRHPGVPRRFWLVQKTTSGSEIAAEGTQSSQGRVVVFSADDSDVPASIWPSMEAVLEHHPETTVHWLDQDRLLAHCIP